MFHSTGIVLQNLIDNGATYVQRGDASSAYEVLITFQFVFVLHLMEEVMGITNILCQSLQQKSQDILNAMNLVSSTKNLIQDLRDNGWDRLLNKVISFCQKNEIKIPDMTVTFDGGRSLFSTRTGYNETSLES